MGRDDAFQQITHIYVSGSMERAIGWRDPVVDADGTTVLAAGRVVRTESLGELGATTPTTVPGVGEDNLGVAATSLLLR